MQIKLESPTKTVDLKYGIIFSWCQGLFVVVVWCLTQCWSHSQYALYDHLSESGALPWTCIWLRKMGSICLPECKTRFVSKVESQDINIAYIDFLLHLSKTPSSLLRSVQKGSQLSKTDTKNLMDAVWICSCSPVWFTGLQVIMGLHHKGCYPFWWMQRANFLSIYPMVD